MRLEKHRPATIRVLGRNYSVGYHSDLDNLFGQCDSETCKIDVVEGLHPVEELDTLIHEILHALFFTMNLRKGIGMKKEESLVRPLATGVVQVLMDNPHLLKYILKVADSQGQLGEAR